MLAVWVIFALHEAHLDTQQKQERGSRVVCFMQKGPAFVEGLLIGLNAYGSDDTIQLKD